jgi:hypothetical protein
MKKQSVRQAVAVLLKVDVLIIHCNSPANVHTSPPAPAYHCNDQMPWPFMTAGRSSSCTNFQEATTSASLTASCKLSRSHRPSCAVYPTSSPAMSLSSALAWFSRRQSVLTCSCAFRYVKLSPTVSTAAQSVCVGRSLRAQTAAGAEASHT